MSRSGGSEDYSVRTLAEILQEHGLETELGTRPGRRRKEVGSKADWPALPAPEDQPRSRLRPPPEPGPGTSPPRPAPPPSAPSYAAILREHGLESEFGTRPDRRRGGGAAPAERPASPAPGGRRRAGSEPAPAQDGPARSSAGRGAAGAARTAAPRSAPGREVPPRTPTPRAPVSPAAPVAPVPRTPAQPPSPDVPLYGRRSTDAPLPPALAPGAMPAAGGPSTAAIPALRAARAADGATVAAGKDADTPAPTRGQAALAWLRFVGELVLAVAAGVGIYFAFTVLWELVPYGAVVAVPAVVTALVAGVAAWRHRRGQAELGVRLLAALVFAGTLLAVAPAAALLAGR
jgi:hypothetical protein